MAEDAGGENPVAANRKVCGVRDGAEHGVGGAGGQAAAAVIEEKGGIVAGALPGGAIVDPFRQDGAEFAVQRDFAIGAVSASADDQMGVAGREVDVADVEADGFADAGAGVERGEGDRLVPQRRAVGFPKKPELVAFTQHPRGVPGDVKPFRGGGARPTSAVEVIDRDQMRVDGGRFALGHYGQVGAVGAYRLVAYAGVGDRVAAERPGLEGGG